MMFLSAPAATLLPANAPKKVFLFSDPVDSLYPALYPTPTLKLPVVLLTKEYDPTPVLLKPVVVSPSELKPMPVLWPNPPF